MNAALLRLGFFFSSQFPPCLPLRMPLCLCLLGRERERSSLLVWMWEKTIVYSSIYGDSSNYFKTWEEVRTLVTFSEKCVVFFCFFLNTWLEKFNASVCGEQRALYEHKSKLLSVKHRLSHMDPKQIHVTVRIPGIRMSININQERSHDEEQISELWLCCSSSLSQERERPGRF